MIFFKIFIPFLTLSVRWGLDFFIYKVRTRLISCFQKLTSLFTSVKYYFTFSFVSNSKASTFFNSEWISVLSDTNREYSNYRLT